MACPGVIVHFAANHLSIHGALTHRRMREQIYLACAITLAAHFTAGALCNMFACLHSRLVVTVPKLGPTVMLPLLLVETDKTLTAQPRMSEELE